MRSVWLWPKNCWHKSSIVPDSVSSITILMFYLGDGCLMEGVSHESCSLAGTWKLNKLIALYDDNSISIDGNVKGWFTDNTPERFEAYGWNVIRDVNGHDVAAVDAAIVAAQQSDQTDADLLQDSYRKRISQQGRVEQGTWFSAGRRGNCGDPQGHWLGLSLRL